MTSFFFCDPEQTMLDELKRESERDWLQWNHEQDLARERELATRYMDGNEECPWPWYADKPFEVVEPEIIDAIAD
jgi:hypothetical protein